MSAQFFDTERAPTAAEIQQAEQLIGRPLPEQYKQHLMRHNGGRPEPTGFDITWHGQEWASREDFGYGMVHYFYALYDGGTSSLLKEIASQKGYIPDDTIPVAYDPGRNLILLGVAGANTGRVFFWAADYAVDEGETPDHSNVGTIADSFDEFIGSLFEIDDRAE